MVNGQQRRGNTMTYPLYRESRRALYTLLFVYSSMTLAVVSTLIKGVSMNDLTLVGNALGVVGLVVTILALIFGRLTPGQMPLPARREGGIIVSCIDMIQWFMGKEILPGLAALPLAVFLASWIIYSFLGFVVSLILNMF